MTDLAEPTEDGYYWVSFKPLQGNAGEPTTILRLTTDSVGPIRRWWWSGDECEELWSSFAGGVTAIEPVVPSSWSRTPAQALAALQESEQRARGEIERLWATQRPLVEQMLREANWTPDIYAHLRCKFCGMVGDHHCESNLPPVPAHPSGPA